jgi:hypothetical protein
MSSRSKHTRTESAFDTDSTPNTLQDEESAIEYVKAKGVEKLLLDISRAASFRYGPRSTRYGVIDATEQFSQN